MANPSRYAYAENGQPPVVSELYPDDFPAGFVPDFRLSYTHIPCGIPGGAWRSTLHSSNAFAVQSFVNELAHATGRDPLAFRLDLLGAPRQLRLQGPRWSGIRHRPPGRGAPARRREGRLGSRVPEGRARGIAGHFTFGSYAAHVVDIARAADGFRVERVVVAVDCGLVVNRSGAEAQVQGGVLDGLSAALYGGVTVEAGRVRETNFDRYRLTRMREAPRVETWFVSSEAPPSGLGEPPVPPVAPALASAIFALTGEQPRRLPLITPPA